VTERCDEHTYSREPPEWWPRDHRIVSPHLFDIMISMAGHCRIGWHDQCFTRAAYEYACASEALFFEVDRAR
jgi:hypothetical protein